MRNIKITAAVLGVISASTLPAIAGPAGHGGNFGGGQAMQAVAAAPQSGQATAKASSAKKMVQSAAGQKVQSAASQKDAAPTTSTRLEAQKNGVSELQSAKAQISPAVSAKAQQASAKLKSLQTQQQISVQSLSIANSSTGTVGEVFR